MINKIKDLITKFGKEEEIQEESNLTLLNNSCAALLVEIAFADKDFDETEKASLKQSLIETYAIDESDIEEIIRDAEDTVSESTSLYGYTSIVNTEFQYEDKLKLEFILILEFSIYNACLLYTSPSPRDMRRSRMPSSA